jgi:hypothetical protein
MAMSETLAASAAAEPWLEQDRADLTAFGRKFLASPGRPARFRLRAPLNPDDAATHHGGGAKGYTDCSPRSGASSPGHVLMKDGADAGGHSSRGRARLKYRLPDLDQGSADRRVQGYERQSERKASSLARIA